MNMERPLSGAERAKRWRAAMRAKGLRPRTFWLPDTTTPEYRERARRDCELLNRWYAAHADEIDEIMSLQARFPDEDD